MATEKKFNLIKNCETQEETLVEFTAEEYAEAEAAAAAEAEADVARQAEADRVEALKVSARAKLVAGTKLTAEEAALLVV